MATAEPQKAIPIEALNPQQLLMVKKNVEEELVMLSQSSNQFNLAMKKFEESKLILKTLGDPSNKEKTTLIPVTNSLYIEGVIDNNDSVLIDYGTGYFVERNIPKASSFCDRKIAMLKENMEKVASMIKAKRKLIDQLTLELQRKVQLQMQMQAGAAQK